MKGFKAGIVLALVLGLFAGAAFAAEPIRIGLLAPLTGPAAADGQSVLNSVKIAGDADAVLAAKSDRVAEWNRILAA